MIATNIIRMYHYHITCMYVYMHYDLCGIWIWGCLSAYRLILWYWLSVIFSFQAKVNIKKNIVYIICCCYCYCNCCWCLIKLTVLSGIPRQNTIKLYKKKSCYCFSLLFLLLLLLFKYKILFLNVSFILITHLGSDLWEFNIF